MMVHKLCNGLMKGFGETDNKVPWELKEIMTAIVASLRKCLI